MKDSLEELSKSQLFDVNGQTITVSVPVEIGSASNKTEIRLLNNVIIDQKYKITGLLGEGGMGAVYKAHHLMLDKEMALKTFKSAHLTGDAWIRFQREAQAIARLSHINIVQVFDFGTSEDNVPYYTMEYLVGESLADRLARQGPLPLDQTIAIFLQVCQALTVAHNKGLIHRDLKPANIFLTGDTSRSSTTDLVKIVDFGIAGLVNESLEVQRLTKTGLIFGSPLYMSPEQSLGRQTSERSDIYSCGCCLFETLTGSVPFRGANAFATMLEHQQSPVPDLNEISSQRQFTQEVNALVQRMLAKNENRRHQSFDEIGAALRDILLLQDREPSSRAKTSSDSKTYSQSKVTSNLRTASSAGTPSSPALIDQAEEEDQKPETPFANPMILTLSGILFLIVIGVVSFHLYSKLSEKATTANSAIIDTSIMEMSKTTQKPAQPPGTDMAHNHSISHYLQPPPSSAVEELHFVFPTDKSLGFLDWYYDDNREHPSLNRAAQGSVILPATPLLTLEAGDALADSPEMFTGFGPNDLAGLFLSTDNTWGDKHLSYIAKLTGLLRLDMKKANVTNRGIDDLNKLSNLRDLFMRRTSITGPALANLKVLPRLRELEAAGTKNFAVALKKMINCRSILVLFVAEVDLKDDDMKVIGTMSNLEQLDVSTNWHLSDRGLSQITKLRKLWNLNLGNTAVTPACIATLGQLQSLERLSIDLNHWTATDKQKLKAALPRCSISPFVNNQKEQLKEMTRGWTNISPP